MIKIRIIQILPTIKYGDAVSNDALNIDEILKKRGYEVFIYAENIDKRLNEKVKKIEDLDAVDKDDIIIYHKSTGTKLSYTINKYKCKKIMRYHNITPSKYFEKYNKVAYDLVEYGHEGLKYVQKFIDYSLPVSEYNKQELMELGYKNTEVLPILISFNDYEKEEDKNIMEKYSDKKKNILFVGRVAPNKAYEDIIRSFYYYKKYVNNNSRLILVGTDDSFKNYSRILKKFIDDLSLDDVIFTGHIKFEEILAYYKTADLFLCMSEHEGFCVPLVESMYFEVPILAYNSSAIKETLKYSGVIVNRKDYFLISELMDLILSREDIKEKIIRKQNERLKDFKTEKIENQLVEFIERIKRE